MKLGIGLAVVILFAAIVYGTDFEENGETQTNKDEPNAEINRDGINKENINILSEITHYTKLDDYIDISLSRESYTESCMVQLPNSDTISANTLEMEGVKVQPASVFVSCRISIGPMTEDLIGDWGLCGVSENGEQRCQPVKIGWHDAARPLRNWETGRRAHIFHPVHYGGMVNTGVAEIRLHNSGIVTGNIISCHVITPSGEDLVLKTDMTYPNIVRTEINHTTLCAAVFNINKNMLGDWVLYGRFRAGSAQTEHRLPMTFYIYNKNDPYEQSYNVTEITETDQYIRLGDTYTEKINGSGKVNECIFIPPSGKSYNLDSGSSKAGVLLNTLENEVACQLTIYPVTNTMLGAWQFIAKFNDGNQFNEKQSIFNLIAEEWIPNPESENPDHEEDEENMQLLGEIDHFTKQDAIIDISLNKESFEEVCYVRSPGGQLIEAGNLNVEGVQVQTKSTFVSCRITIGPMTENLLGKWRLCGKSVENNEMRCQPTNIAWNTNNMNWHPTIQERFYHPVHFGGSVNPGVLGEGLVTTCHLVTPAGEDLVIPTDVKYPHIERIIGDSELCSIIIKDITGDLLGDWIVYGHFRSIFGQNEVRLPINLFLYDENNPFEQAYNVTALKDQQHLVNIGTDITMQVRHTTGTVEDCIYTAPSGQKFDLNNLPNYLDGVSFNTSESVCQVTLNPITDASVGEWNIIGKFSNGVLFNELRQIFRIIKEDPANPLEDEIHREVQTLTPQDILTSMETTHRIVLNQQSWIENESCHLITPDGLQYAFIPGFNVPGIEIINESDIECGVILSLESEEMIGEWILIARATDWLSKAIERRLPFNIQVEENFIIQNDISISEGTDLYLHLHQGTNVPETCKLYGPDGNEYTNVETDLLYSSSCGYIVRNINHEQNGTWIIEYGDRMKFRGSVDVIVLGSQAVSIDNLRWTTGESIDIFVGPENAVYCKIEDSRGRTLFDTFGQCRIIVNRVTIDHGGTWKMFVGVPGSVLMQEYGFYVDVQPRDNKPTVTTAIERVAPSVMLTCSVPNEHEVNACKFRDPRGNILIAAHGVGEGGYMFNGSVVNYQSDADSHDCTLRLTNPSALDLGIWRCALDTNTGTYYAFLTVLCPFLMQNPEIAASVVTNPVLEAETSLRYLEDEPVDLSCTISTPLRYCYFRARNGTVFNVFPGMSTSQNFEYVGAGLDAGDCGIRFSSLSASEAGRWTCHVGLVDVTAEEQNAEIIVDVQARMTVRHYLHESSSSLMVVEAVVYDHHPIDYCRFVKITGQGFTSENVPTDRYNLLNSLHEGNCTLYITNPDIIDAHPWTIAAKLTGIDGEISRATTDNLLVFPAQSNNNIYGKLLFWVLIIFLCIIPLVIAFALISKKNREWTFKRASNIRNSFKNSWNNSFKKKPAPQQQEP